MNVTNTPLPHSIIFIKKSGNYKWYPLARNVITAVFT